MQSSNQSSDSNSNKSNVIDEALYSRQLYVIGHEAMQRLFASSVLIIGCNGVGVETAKNLALAGAPIICVHDVDKVETKHLSGQFFLSEEDRGKYVIDVTVPKLAELNPYVTITGHREPLTLEFLGQFMTVVACEMPLSEQLHISNFCHSKGIHFISTSSYGVFGSVFCDVGENFVVSDKDGETPSSGVIISITENGIVTVLEDQRHNLEDGDFVTLRDVKGMTEVNNLPPTQVKVIDPFSFEIKLPNQFSPYTSGGRFLQVKQPITVNFLSLEEAIKKPEFLDTDFAKLGRASLIHACHLTVENYGKKFGHFPRPGNHQDQKDFSEMVLQAYPTYASDLEAHKVIRYFAHCVSGKLNPVAAFLGGVVAQEVLKASTGKFMPLKQFLYFDAIEALPSNIFELPESEFVAKPDLARYEGQIVVFGNTFQEKLMNLNYFLVGAGAIGCEMLKNFAMMGVGCGEKGRVTITDMDKIEKSNLNRQFLFRPWHLEQSKSSTAAAVAREMNKKLNITAYEVRVGSDTESIFHESFFESLDGVCNALDNVEARLYVDSRCVLFQKSLLESGTLGTKGNVQVIVPHLTESYGSSADPPEKGIPICTLKHFPNKIEHTIQYAREEFEATFKTQPVEVNQYITNPNFISSIAEQRNTRIQSIETVYKSLVAERPSTFDQCIEWARLKFEELFNYSIQQLLHNFPADSTDSHGNLFWSGSKQAPAPIFFSHTNPLHMQYLIASANLRASVYGIEKNTNEAHFVSVISKMIIPDFKPKQGVHIPTTEKEAENSASSAGNGVEHEISFEEYVKTLPQPSSLNGFKLNPVEFEKDNDANFHMQYITAVSNLRATNYSIPVSDFHETKRIAGKIIPAIATTTALVTGLVGIELYKVHQNKKLEDYKNSFVNLALPFFTFSEPLPPPKIASVGRAWTLWDKTIVDRGDVTLKEFLQYFKDTFNLEPNMISCGRSMIYTSFTPKKKLEERYKMKMSDLVVTISKQPLNANSKYITFEVYCSDANGVDVEIPTVRYKYC